MTQTRGDDKTAAVTIEHTQAMDDINIQQRVSTVWDR